MTQRWPLVGRVEELRFALEHGRGPGCPGGVVLAGAAGVGKTRLAREAARHAVRRREVVRWVSATACARGLPLGAFGGLAGTAPLDSVGFLALTSRALLKETTPESALLVIDDAHLLDEISAALVHHLVVHRLARVLLTYRSGESAPDAVTALWKDRHLARLELQPLSCDETGQLLRAVLGAPVAANAVRSLWRSTHGNVLYLRELVTGERAAGRLRAHDGLWSWTGRPQLTPDLVELIRARMGDLPTGVDAVVDLVAFGEPIGVATLRDITSAHAVEAAETRGLIEIRTQGRRLEACLAHPLFGEVRRASIGLLRARRIRGVLAAALAATGNRRAEDVLRCATLALDSDQPPDPGLLLAAAQRATLVNSCELGERLARAAVAAGGGFDAALLLASVLVGSATEAAEEEIACATTAATTDDQRVCVTLLHVMSLAWINPRPRDAEAVLERAESTVADEAGLVTLGGLRVLFDAAFGRPAHAVARACEVLASPLRSEEAEAFACLGAIVASAALGEVADLQDLAHRGIDAAARSAGAAWMQPPILAWQVFALRLAGNLQEATRLAREGAARFAEHPGPSALFAVVSAVVDLAAGRISEAVDGLREACAYLSQRGNGVGGWLFAAHLYLTEAVASTGDGAAARRAQADLDTHEHPGFTVLRPEVILARAWVAVAEGALSQGRALASEAAALANTAGQHAHEVLALHTVVRFGDHRPAERLAALAADLKSPRATAAAAHAAALAAADASRLIGACGQLEDLGALLLAADAAAQAATVLTSEGRYGSSRTAAARAHYLASACAGACTPALRAIQAPLPLTAREREILTLAANGYTNSDIAARLILSIRTVEGHRYRGSTKLGTHDLRQVAALLAAPNDGRA